MRLLGARATESSSVLIRRLLSLLIGMIAAWTEKVTDLFIGIRYRCLMCRHLLWLGIQWAFVGVVGRNKAGLLSIA